MYGIDFRSRVIAHYNANGSLKETARLFDLDRHTISRWNKGFAQTGSLERKPLNRSFKKVDPQKLKEFYDKTPDALQKDAAETFGVHRSSIQYALKKINYTRKKNTFCTKNGMKKKGKNI
ncbi:MAG: transposase [Holosporales bacterium]|jgi:transposase|nr:transposase [Holosporales bacterium]